MVIILLFLLGSLEEAFAGAQGLMNHYLNKLKLSRTQH
ncbi:hypothetical protein E2C01_039258 [Portunus trituberculatus]|uniref:Uncharacterized protein n=1 Tax=Portunus trituberculatus TaxID=210409 RepID=A0A5B7FJD7_PORTR|nr:hypothetical protein [Portunus trituberculatus]